MNTEFSLGAARAVLTADAINELVGEAYDNSTEHGFTGIYDGLMAAVPSEQKKAMRRTTILAKLGLIASEVGEAVSAVQHGDDAALAEELADVVIRVMDLCGGEHINLGREILAKMQRNRQRPYLHGKEC